MTNSVTGPRRSSKALPKGKFAPKKNVVEEKVISPSYSSAISQKDKEHYNILTHIYGI